MTWTGTIRREQGHCRPPAKARMIYRIRCNAKCRVYRNGQWHPHVTTHAMCFHDYERRVGTELVFDSSTDQPELIAVLTCFVDRLPG